MTGVSKIPSRRAVQLLRYLERLAVARPRAHSVPERFFIALHRVRVRSAPTRTSRRASGFFQLSELSSVTNLYTPLQRPTAFWQLDGARAYYPIKRSNPTCPNGDTSPVPARPQPGVSGTAPAVEVQRPRPMASSSAG